MKLVTGIRASWSEDAKAKIQVYMRKLAGLTDMELLMLSQSFRLKHVDDGDEGSRRYLRAEEYALMLEINRRLQEKVQ